MLCLVRVAFTKSMGLDKALGIAGRAANGLDQAGLAAQEALFIRIQNGHKAHLRQVDVYKRQS